MRHFFRHHGECFQSRLVFLAGTETRGEASFEIGTDGAKSDVDFKGPEIKRLEFDESLKADSNQSLESKHWDRIDETYGQSVYTQTIQDYAAKLLPGGPANYRDSLVQGSVKRYMVIYGRIKLLFMQRGEALKTKFDKSVDYIIDKTQNELGVLKSAVSGSQEYLKFTGRIPPIKNKSEVRDYFDDFQDAMNGRYFNTDVNEGVVIPGYGIPVLDPILNPDVRAIGDAVYPEEKENIPLVGIFTGSDYFKGIEYRNRRDTMQANMKNWIEAKLEYILDKPGATQQDLIDFRQEVTDRYNMYSTADKNNSIISGKDMAILDRYARPPLGVMDSILTGDESAIIQRLEIMQIMNPDLWEEIIERAGKSVIEAARSNAAEDNFLEATRKHAQADDFDDAVGEFEDLLEAQAKVGPKEALQFIQEFNQEVHGETLEYEAKVKPPAFAVLVGKQLDYLLGRALVPHREGDKTLVRFMTASRDMKDDMLDDDRTRVVLFQAIKMATDVYPEVFDKQFRTIPDEVVSSESIESPSTHDRAAQLQALIVLGNQANVVVRNLENTPEHRGRGYGASIDESPVPDDIKAVHTGLRFKSPIKNIRYASALERGGFSTRGLALKGAKLLGVLAVVANVAQSWSETDGDFVERIFQTGERALTNQGVLAGAAVATGAHLAERNPQFLKYPWLSKHERAGLVAGFKMDNIAARLSSYGVDGHQELKNYTENDAEWRVLSHPKMSPDTIRELLKEKAKDRKSGEKPKLTIEDIKTVIPEKGNESIFSTMYRSGVSARTRYLFYSKFFASAVKPDVNHVKELCTGKGYIATSPVKSKPGEAFA